MKNFFSRLSYSFGNEDWNTEYQALKIRPKDRVVCITASGDRPLNLLLQDCEQVVSVDANRVQNYLLKLKGAALKELSHEEYVDFLFAKKGGIPSRTLERVFRWLDPEARIYWARRQGVIQKGVVYQGVTEVWCRRIYHLTRLFRGKKMERLFSIHDLEEQKEFVQKEWDTWGWRKVFEWTLNPFFTKWMLKDPGMYFNVDDSIRHAGLYIYERMHQYLQTGLAKRSLMLSLILQGRVHEDAYPPYLIKNTSQIIKERLDRLHIQTKDVISYLESAEDEQFDCFSLSDVASYISSKDFERLLRVVLRTAKPGARFSIREFMSSQQIPKDLTQHFHRDKSLEKQLEKEDHCFVYKFMVGEISK